MKPLHIPFIVVGLLAPFLLTAQSLHLIGSNPASNSANVALTTTVTFQFDQALQLGTLSLDSIGDRFMVSPHGLIQLHTLTYSPDQRSVSFEVSHQPNTDYTWAFYGLRAASGAVMNTFGLVRYSTYPANSPFHVSGRLILQDPAPDEDFSLTIVMLLSDLSFMTEEDSDGPQESMRYAVAPDAITGEYRVDGVRPGTYYMIAMMFSGLNDDMEPVRIGLLTNQDDEPIPLVITNVSAENVDLTMRKDIGPGESTDATRAFARANVHMAELNPLARPLVIEGYSHVMPPNGEAYEWMVAYFSEADSMVTMIETDGDRILGVESFHYMSMSPEERLEVDLSTIKSIPNLFIPSQEALHVALQNGLGGDLIRFMETDAHWMEMSYKLNHFYFEYPEFTTVASNPFWVVEFSVNSQRGWFEAAYLIDSQTGLFLGRTERSEIWNPGSFELTSSTPAHMASNIPLQARIGFTFSEPVNVGTLSFQSQMQTWVVMPADRIAIYAILYSEDYRTVWMDVIHTAETDYVWSFQGVRGVNGSVLETAEIVNYSTRAETSPLIISGSLIWPDPDPFPSTDQAMAVVVLLDSPDYFLHGMNGPPPGIQNVGANDPGTWMYRIENVRPGTYYPAVFVMGKPMDQNNLIAYGFLPNEDGTPRSITLTDQSFTSFNLPLRYNEHGGEHHRIDVSQVIDVVRDHVAHQGHGAELITLFGREEIRRPDMPNGTSYDWGFIFFEAATDTVQMMQAGSDGIFAIDRFHFTSIPEEERIPKELVQPLPGSFINSGQAVSTALNHGLAELIHSTPEGAWMQLRYDLSRFYFRHPDILTSTAPPFWELQYNAELYAMDQQLLWSREAIFLVDATNGVFIHKSVTTALDDEDRAVAFQLDQNVPNPFNPTTVIGFSVGTQDLTSLHTRLTVYDILGRQVAVLVDGVMPAGSHHVTFSGASLPSGVYLYRLESGGKTLQRKFTLIK